MNGDQREQEDRRNVFGGRLTHRRLGTFIGRHVESGSGRAASSRRDRQHRAVQDSPRAPHRHDPRGCGVDRRRSASSDRAKSNGPGPSGRRSDCAATGIGSMSIPAIRSTPARTATASSARSSRRCWGRGRDRALRQRRARVPQQRCARRDDHRGSKHWRTRRARHAACPRPRRRVRRPHGANSRAAVDGGAVVSRLRLGAPVHRRCGHHRGESSESSPRRRVDELCATEPMADGRSRRVLLAREIHRRRPRWATSSPVRSTASYRAP